jgi:alpha-1,2-mannosyltransferase
MRPSRLFAVLAGVALFAAGEMAVLQGRIGMRDFRVNRTAGDRLLHGETPYRISDEHYQFKYSPFSASLYVPFALLPESAAKAVWFGLVFAAIVFLIIASAHLAGPRGARTWGAGLVAAVILAKYLFRELELGQINALVAALFFSAAGLLGPAKTPLQTGRQAAAGVLGGLAAAMKPYGLIILPYWILKKRWTALAASLAVLAATYFVPVVYFGLSGNAAVHREWIAGLSQSTPPLLTSQDNISLLGFFSKWLGPSGPVLPAFGVLLIVLGMGIVAYIAKASDRERSAAAEGALLLLLIPLVSPLGWDYTFLASLPAVAFIVAHWRNFPRAGRILLCADFAVIALSLYDVLGRRLYASFMAWSVLTVCFLGLIPALAYLRWKRGI